MPALTPSFLMDVESRMQVITEREYNRFNANVWWPRITKLRGSTGRRDVIMWLLSTAQIRDQGKGGNINFSDLVSTYTEIEAGSPAMASSCRARNSPTPTAEVWTSPGSGVGTLAVT
jgi:hypothetical protein